jgi:flagellar L-ring protein precursor FlgH
VLVGRSPRAYPQPTQDKGPPPNEILLATSLIAVEAPQPREIRVHDQITVVIREEKRSTSDSNLKREKKWEIDAELKKWIRLNEECKLVPQVFPAGNPAIDLNYDDKYEGKGKVGRQDSLVTRVTATVVDVKPNGILVLQAKKDIRIDEDRQVVTLTGTCRSEDVTPQNTVLSTQLAAVQIDIQHSGPARDAARRGWLARLWDLIRPL